MGHAARQDQFLEVIDRDEARSQRKKFTEEMLKDMGYSTVGYTESPAALQALLAEPQRYALVITDEVMPSLSGTALAQVVHAQLPDLPLVLLSGYGGPLMAAKATAAGVSQLMLKPLRREELVQVMAELLPHLLPRA